MVSVAPGLGLPAVFPIAKGLIFTEAQKEARMRELQEFLRSCLAALPTTPCGREREAALSLQSFLNTELFAAAEATEATPTEAAEPEAAVFGVFV